MWQSNKEPAWIFVSHASKDLANVRKVRNYLEDKGAAPLLFHLKAMRTPEQFWPLIEQEISARRFFLYCDSPNAVASDWVRREREAVARLPVEPKIGHIDVSQSSLDTLALDTFLRRSRVYLSFSRFDREFAERCADAMRGADYQVYEWDNTAADAGKDLKDVLVNAIDWVAGAGVLVVLLSERSMTSPWVRFEIEYALSRGVTVVPVVAGPRGSFEETTLFHLVGQLSWVFPTMPGADDQPNRLVETLARLV